MKRVTVPNGWQAATPAVRPLLAWGTPQLEAVATALQARLASWAAAWGLQPPRQQVTCIRVQDAGETPWLPLVQQKGAGAWTWQSQDFCSWVGRNLVGVESPNTPLATAVLAACMDDLRLRLAAVGAWSPCSLALRGETAPPVLARWSEGILTDLPLGLRLLLDAAAVSVVLKECRAPQGQRAGTPERQAVSSLASAIAHSPMRVRVRLEGCEIDLGSLRELQVGDVLRLRHRIEEPGLVCTGVGDALCKGFLVRSRGRKAVELAPAA